jgi:hypothetical protein
VFITESGEVAGVFLMSYIKYSICLRHQDYVQVSPCYALQILVLHQTDIPPVSFVSCYEPKKTERGEGTSCARREASTHIAGRNNRGTWNMLGIQLTEKEPCFETKTSSVLIHTNRLHVSVAKVSAN